MNDNSSNLPDFIVCIPEYGEEDALIDIRTDEIEMKELKNRKDIKQEYKEQMSTKLLLSIDNKVERVLFRFREVMERDVSCLDCLCRCFSCTSFVLSIINWFR